MLLWKVKNEILGRMIRMVAYDNSVTPATSKTTRYYYDDQRVLLETDYDDVTGYGSR